jgi:nitroreductase
MEAAGQGVVSTRLVRETMSRDVVTVDPDAPVRFLVERGGRYLHIEAGHAAQNVYLQAAALGLGTTIVGAFRDEELKRVIGLGAGEEPLAIMPVGMPVGRR